MKPKELAVAFLLLTPKSAGDKRITAKFKSRELNDVDGYRNVRVSEDFDDNNNVESNVDLDASTARYLDSNDYEATVRRNQN